MRLKAVVARIADEFGISDFAMSLFALYFFHILTFYLSREKEEKQQK